MKPSLPIARLALLLVLCGCKSAPQGGAKTEERADAEKNGGGQELDDGSSAAKGGQAELAALDAKYLGTCSGSGKSGGVSWELCIESFDDGMAGRAEADEKRCDDGGKENTWSKKRCDRAGRYACVCNLNENPPFQVHWVKPEPNKPKAEYHISGCTYLSQSIQTCKVVEIGGSGGSGSSDGANEGWIKPNVVSAHYPKKLDPVDDLYRYEFEFDENTTPEKLTDGKRVKKLRILILIPSAAGMKKAPLGKKLKVYPENNTAQRDRGLSEAFAEGYLVEGDGDQDDFVSGTVTLTKSDEKGGGAFELSYDVKSQSGTSATGKVASSYKDY